MKFTIQVPAPASAMNALLLRLAYQPHYTPELLAEVRQLLLVYPPQAIARNLEHACDQLVQEGHSPDFPDNGQMEAYLELLEGLWSLSKISHHMPAAVAA